MNMKYNPAPAQGNKLRKQLNIGNNANMGCDNLSRPARRGCPVLSVCATQGVPNITISKMSGNKAFVKMK